MDQQGKRKLKIDLEELDSAFDNGDFDMRFYLDRQTGDIPLITADIESELASITGEIEGVAPDEMDAAFREALEKSGLDPWDKEMVLETYLIETDILGSRYVEVPPQSSRDGYRDMEEFIETVQNELLQERLWRAIDGRGAFRAFRNELYDHEDERQRWYAFRDARLRERVLHWLAEEGIEPITE